MIICCTLYLCWLKTLVWCELSQNKVIDLDARTKSFNNRVESTLKKGRYIKPKRPNCLQKLY